MKKFLLIVLALHIAMEGIVGFILAFSPDSFMPGATAESMQFMAHYGFAGMTMSIFAIWYWFNRSNAELTSFAIGILALFHTMQAMAGVVIASRGGSGEVIISHGLFAVCFWVLWARRNRLIA